MKISQKYSLINDLEKSLTTIFEDSEYEFNFNGDQLYVEEVFKSNMFLPLFLFDKQKLIYRFCAEKLGTPYHAQIILQQNKDAVFNFTVTIEHNLKNHTQYILLLKFLISLVVADSCFNKLKIDLDYKYHYLSEIMNKTFAQPQQ